MNIGFIGLGLIGGSIAKAIKHFYPNAEISAYDVNRDTLSQALSEGVIDYACTGIDEQLAANDYLFLCATVSRNRENLALLKEHLRPDCIITDVGSVKTGIHETVTELQLEHQFIGGHPMAGSEKSGYPNARRHLIENAYYILTPAAKVPPDMVKRYQDFVASLKALPLVLDYQKHDYVTAAISHLPHIVAAGLVNVVKDSDSKDGLMKTIAAGGFKDITRIASASPDLWQQVCLSNTANITEMLNAYIKELSAIKDSIERKEQARIYKLFSDASEYRNSIPDHSAGPIKKSFSIYCDIIDEAGGIATIATILATNHINIKNIGIIHNREFEEGVLRIEFYDDSSLLNASALLERHHYTIYQR